MAGTLHTVIISSPPHARTFSRHLLHGDPHFTLNMSTQFRCRLDYFKPIRASIPKPDPIGENESNTNGKLSFSWANLFFQIAERNFLPLALTSGLILGLANPSLGCFADRYSVSKFGPFGIFVLSGLTLRSGEIGAAAKAWPVGLFGLISILFLTPFFSKLILLIQLQPQEFVTGLAIFCCMPTTLSSGVALTQLAGGNTALALALTVLSNLIGIILIPISISRYVANGIGVALPTKQLFRSLVTTILIPLILGKVLRESFKGVSNFVDQNRGLLSKINAIFLSLVPWIQVSRSRSLLLLVKPESFLVAIALGTLLHITLLTFNALLMKGLSACSGGDRSVFSVKENSTAALLVASQKTLPVMVAVIEPLQGALGESGLLILPCVAAHLNQIVFDSFLVNVWFRNKDRNNVKES